MGLKDYLFTSESVNEGHPDKICDQISDAVLDAFLDKDPQSHVACETLVTTGLIVIAGEVTSKATVDFQQIARNTVAKIGYNDSSKGFCHKTCSVLVGLGKQSPDIARGVDVAANRDQGAGDQGMMFGYAINETEEYMPYSIALSHQLSQRLTEVRKDGTLGFLRPDGKTQVTMEYKNGKATRVDTVVISSQHDENVTMSSLEEGIRTEVISKIVSSTLMDNNTKIYINPTGRFVIGGPQGDCGLTGRKIIADTYGGHGSHGGGAFSGKDPSKVDRSACYMARYAAKNIVAAGLADRCLLQVGYAIGVAKPVSFMVDCFGTEKIDLEKIFTAARELFPFQPSRLIEKLRLLRPVYAQTSVYGHFGRRGDAFTWEETDSVEKLKELCGV